MLKRILKTVGLRRLSSLKQAPVTNHLRADIGLTTEIHEKPILPPIPYC